MTLNNAISITPCSPDPNAREKVRTWVKSQRKLSDFPGQFSAVINTWSPFSAAEVFFRCTMADRGGMQVAYVDYVPRRVVAGGIDRALAHGLGIDGLLLGSVRDEPIIFSSRCRLKKSLRRNAARLLLAGLALSTMLFAGSLLARADRVEAALRLEIDRQVQELRKLDQPGNKPLLGSRIMEVPADGGQVGSFATPLMLLQTAMPANAAILAAELDNQALKLTVAEIQAQALSGSLTASGVFTLESTKATSPGVIEILLVPGATK